MPKKDNVFISILDDIPLMNEDNTGNLIRLSLSV